MKYFRICFVKFLGILLPCSDEPSCAEMELSMMHGQFDGSQFSGICYIIYAMKDWDRKRVGGLSGIANFLFL